MLEKTEKAPERGIRKVMEGVIVSSKMEKSVVVAISTYKKDPHFGKFVRKTKKYKAHDETNQCAEGDRVTISECRPLSKSKRWKVESIIEKAI